MNASDGEFSYIGDELPLFANAVHWKRYFGAALRPYMRGRVLEVGAGCGATSPFMLTDEVISWTALEPDGHLAAQIAPAFARTMFRGSLNVVAGTLTALAETEQFDCITYIDVLEHLEHDKEELRLAQSKLAPGGFLVVLSPAYQRLSSEFDKAIGHFRRYTRSSLLRVAPPGVILKRAFYLDSVGLIASLANAVLLQQKAPTVKQIAFWDNVMIPLSRVFDPLILHAFGRSVVAVWQKS